MKETAVKGLELPLWQALRLDVGPNPYLSEDRARGHRRLPGEAPAGVDGPLSLRWRSPAGAGRRRTARPATAPRR